MDDAESIVVPAAEESDELLVRAQPQQRRAERDSTPPEPGPGLDGGGFHVDPRATLARGTNPVQRRDCCSDTIACVILV